MTDRDQKEIRTASPDAGHETSDVAAGPLLKAGIGVAALETISKPPAGFARLQSAWICVALNRPITEDRAHSGALPTPISLALGPHSVF